MSVSARPKSRCAPLSPPAIERLAGRGRGADDAACAPALSKISPQRLQGLPIRLAQLSRMVTAADSAQTQARTRRRARRYRHRHACRCSARASTFKNLGLVIIDEEQHFGVRQKERLKELRAEVHVLTLSATPIPRTLQLALSGVRELSIIATPPVDRLAVRTFVAPFDRSDRPRGAAARAFSRRPELFRLPAHRRPRRGDVFLRAECARSEIRRRAWADGRRPSSKSACRRLLRRQIRYAALD